jgi:hypothetical protein
MQFVNDDMDDDLFRQAAEEYPLKTDSGDWNKMMEKMRAGDNAPHKKVGKARYILLLALIPLLLICTTYIKHDSSVAVSQAKKSTSAEQSLPQSELEEKNGSFVRKVADAPGTSNVNIQALNDVNIQSSNKESGNIYGTGKTDRTNHIHQANITGVQIKRDQKQTAINSSNENLVIGDNKENANSVNTPAGNENSGDKESLSTPGKEAIHGSVEIDADKKEVEEQPKEKPVAAFTSGKKIKQAKKPANKFYLGFVAGPDFSMVKSTKSNGAGHSVGLLAGYNLSKKFAIETGILLDHKKYQSDGKYFNTEKLDWPHVTILELSGYCNMYEIPVNLRYNVSANTNRTWFANLGLSSYLMKKENYDYDYERYGVYANGNKEYKNTTNNWLSVVHLSIGLQKKLGPVGELRIEPYVKLPLKGVGIGSMPLTSTGIYLGIIRSIR